MKPSRMRHACSHLEGRQKRPGLVLLKNAPRWVAAKGETGKRSPFSSAVDSYETAGLPQELALCPHPAGGLSHRDGADLRDDVFSAARPYAGVDAVVGGRSGGDHAAEPLSRLRSEAGPLPDRGTFLSGVRRYMFAVVRGSARGHLHARRRAGCDRIRVHHHARSASGGEMGPRPGYDPTPGSQRFGRCDRDGSSICDG